ASIQVTCTPASPARRRPSVASSPIPKRVPRRYQPTMSSTTGKIDERNASSPVAAWYARRASMYQRAASAVLYSARRAPAGIQERSVGREHLAGRLGTARGEGEPRDRDHRIPTPFVEPRVARDDREPGRLLGPRAPDEELIRSQDELLDPLGTRRRRRPCP